MNRKELRTTIVLIIIGVVLVMTGALAKLEHWGYANYFIVAGLLSQAIGIVLFVYYLLRAKFDKSK